MKVLIIEDDELKYQHLSNFILKLLPSALLNWQKSYNSGLNEVLSNPYDLVILDMSMHIYEKTAEEPGGSFETYAGQMILSEIDINEISTKVIVVTGYDVYGDGKTLEELKEELREEFGSFYLDAVYFVGKQSKWQKEIASLVQTHFPILTNDNINSTEVYLSILIVEDDNIKSNIIESAVNIIAPKSNIKKVKDQISAEIVLEKEKFDLLILDMQLPIREDDNDISPNAGYDILEQLSFNENLKQPTKTIVLTAYSDLQDKIREDFAEIGALKFDISSNKWKQSLANAIHSLAKSKIQNKKIVYCEEQNDSFYNSIGFLNLEFRGIKGGSRKVYESAKFEEDKYALRDKDYLSKEEVHIVKQKYPNYFILNYYCFENYLYHPSNIKEYLDSKSINFDKTEYINNIVAQKKSKILEIAQDYKAVRNGYIDITENNDKKTISQNNSKVFDALKSDDFETFYPYFDMKGTDKSKGMDKSCLDKLNLDKKELVKTEWFKEQMSKVLEQII